MTVKQRVKLARLLIISVEPVAVTSQALGNFPPNLGAFAVISEDEVRGGGLLISLTPRSGLQLAKAATRQ